jgi:methylmalonyl-CoA mutase N-terminal domain/subunit
MRMFAGFGAAEDTNSRFRSLLAAGQTGLSIAYDMPTLYGYDTTTPRPRASSGRAASRSAAWPTWRSSSAACRSTGLDRR